ncbi:hypothetical protein [Novosphingobium sp. HII-3]|uniref:hypothetical protein n=1 Tax=Novosphingobium sp. HII-3 TaxID=2075565 RepID=UPI000CDAB934|nr:hypothetical protein [Novosphingobium sp. HII-3]
MIDADKLRDRIYGECSKHGRYARIAPCCPQAPATGGEDAVRTAGHTLALAAGALNVATDGMAELRDERVAVLAALKDWQAALSPSAPEAPSEQEADRNLERLIADLRSYAEPSSGSLRIDMSDVKSILALYDRARKIGGA